MAQEPKGAPVDFLQLWQWQFTTLFGVDSVENRIVPQAPAVHFLIGFCSVCASDPGPPFLE